MYNAVLKDCIEREKKGIDYICIAEDRTVLNQMLDEINHTTCGNYQYLAELDLLNIPNCGNIITKYIFMFKSESVKAYLIPQMVLNKTKDCDKLILQLYLGFRKTESYTINTKICSSAHIYVRYDNAFSKMKSKRIKMDLLQLASNPLDVFFLPLTMRMLARWKIPEIEKILLEYLDNTQSIMLGNELELYDNMDIQPSIQFVQRELLFTAIDGLANFTSYEAVKSLEKYAHNTDSDIRIAAIKSLRRMSRPNQGAIL